MSDRTTLDDFSLVPSEGDARVPGVVVVFSTAKPMVRPIALARGRVVLGRNEVTGVLDDERVSREHTEVSFDGDRWTVTDLGSRNGTFVDGEQIKGTVTLDGPSILRMGSTLCLFVEDVRSYIGDGVTVTGDLVAGPSLRHTLDRIKAVAGWSERLLILGESGAGKELAARAFHAAGPHARGRFVAVNCAAIPEGVAERLLFGSLKGAYSGATHDADGYVQAAQDGVLFLDEIGELDLEVQAKLLRMLESKEVLPLGASTARKVNARICFATNRELRVAVANKQFRDDLYYRMTQAQVRLPPLRERLEEMPVLIVRELARIDAALVPHARLVEACLLRPWPGNVRELCGAMRRAADNAHAARSTHVSHEHLDAEAGQPLDAPAEDRHGTPPTRTGEEPTREEIETALIEHKGNMAATARALGLHRTQLYRIVQRLGLKVRDA
jgi:transcriptional regulator with GAF, ATPase, and Fis domain